MAGLVYRISRFLSSQPDAFRSDIAWLCSHLGTRPRAFVFLLVLTGSGSLLAIVDPLIMKWTLDDVIPLRHTVLLAGAAALFLLSYCTRIFLDQKADLRCVQLTQSMIASLRLQLLKSVLRLPGSYHDRVPVGETVFHLNEDIRQVAEITTDLLVEVTRVMVAAVATFAAMLYMNKTVTLILLPMFVLFAIVKHRAGLAFKRECEVVQAHSSRLSVVSQEIVAGVSQIQILRCERILLKRFVLVARKVVTAWVTRKRCLCRLNFIAMAIVVAAVATVLGYGSYLVVNEALTIGALVAFYSYIIRICEPLAVVVDLDSRYDRGRSSLREICRIVAQAPSAQIAQVPSIAPNRSVIAFHRVSFAYAGREPILRNVSFSVDRGEHVVLVGQTGSGKSTVLKLILRIYGAYQGSIYCNGTEISKSNLKLLRSHFSVVPQEIVLFEGSLRENLLLANQSATSEELNAAIEFSQLDVLLRRLKNGLEESVGAQGTQLSGGEKQRVAFARALLQDAPILLLDEFTSALDLDTEGRLLQMLKTRVNARTVIVISHRPAVISWADRILVLEKGELIDHGKRDDLQVSRQEYGRPCRVSL
jgi:subfamily B ATP-binding cassette protein HlyB/CyaB